MPPFFGAPAGGPAAGPLTPPRGLTTALSAANLAQIVLALAVAAIVQLHLRSVAFTPLGESGYGVVRGSCLMGRSYVYGSTCYYAYTVAAASIFASFFLSLIRCARLGVGPWLEVAASAAQAAWWCAAGVVFAVEAARADREGAPARAWRTLVVLLAWVEAALFAGLAAAYGRLARWLRSAAAAAGVGGGGGAGNGWGGGGGPPPPPQQAWGGVQMGPVPPMVYAAYGAPPPPGPPVVVARGVGAGGGGGGGGAPAAAAAVVAPPPPPPPPPASPGGRGNPFAPQP